MGLQIYLYSFVLVFVLVGMIGKVIKQTRKMSIALGRDLDAPSVTPTWLGAPSACLIKFLYHVHAFNSCYKLFEQQNRTEKILNAECSMEIGC